MRIGTGTFVIITEVCLRIVGERKDTALKRRISFAYVMIQFHGAVV